MKRTGSAGQPPANTLPALAPTPVAARLGILILLCVVAAGCGGSGTTVVTAPESLDVAAAAPTTGPAASPAVDFSATRPGRGIAAAGGDLQAVQGPDPCQSPGSAQGRPLTVAFVGADLAELGAIGFEMTTVEEPGLVIDAYIDQINLSGGIGGRCIEFAAHRWSLEDPIGSYIQVCSELGSEPVFYYSFQLYDSGLQCSTFGVPLPTIGLYTSTPESAVAEADYLLYSDDGSVEHLLSRTAEVAVSSGDIDENSRVGLLHGSGSSAGVRLTESERLLEAVGLSVVATAQVRPEFGDLQLLLPEAQSHLTAAREGQDHAGHESLPAEQAATLAQIDEFYPAAAARFKEAGVDVVIATSHWADVRAHDARSRTHRLGPEMAHERHPACDAHRRQRPSTPG